MEIKVGIYNENVEELKSANDYLKVLVTLTRQIFAISGMKIEEEKVYAMAHNLHKFLLDNPQFVVGLVNAGKIKAKILK